MSSFNDAKIVILGKCQRKTNFPVHRTLLP